MARTVSDRRPRDTPVSTGIGLCCRRRVRRSRAPGAPAAAGVVRRSGPIREEPLFPQGPRRTADVFTGNSLFCKPAAVDSFGDPSDLRRSDGRIAVGMCGNWPKTIAGLRKIPG
ncbi:hypothetical protein GCM10010406_19940 [Streptomyces thermolineatus]|uniref:Uncharacterized protein n=1 Tax=Streptomyces thermolineatus TaxID=44033 RepID=A0ABP5YM83_9ACTN